MGDIMFVSHLVGNSTAMDLGGSVSIDMDVMFMELGGSMFMEVGGTMLMNSKGDLW